MDENRDDMRILTDMGQKHFVTVWWSSMSADLMWQKYVFGYIIATVFIKRICNSKLILIRPHSCGHHLYYTGGKKKCQNET